MLRTASDHADLAFHALSFVPAPERAPALVHAASLFRPEWIAWAKKHLPSGAITLIAQDAPLIGALCSTSEIALGLQRFAFLHGSIEQLVASARLPLGEMGTEHVARPLDLRALRELPAAPIEIFRAALALSARVFARAHAEQLRPFAERVISALAPRWDALLGELPALSGLSLRISSTLGPRGRLSESTLHVGTTSLPHPTEPVDTDTPLALAAHEASVHAASEVLAAHDIPAHWAIVERAALDGAALAYAGTSAEQAYLDWRRGLNEDGLAPRDAKIAALALLVKARLRAPAGEADVRNS